MSSARAVIFMVALVACDRSEKRSDNGAPAGSGAPPATKAATPEPARPALPTGVKFIPTPAINPFDDEEVDRNRTYCTRHNAPGPKWVRCDVTKEDKKRNPGDIESCKELGAYYGCTQPEPDARWHFCCSEATPTN